MDHSPLAKIPRELRNEIYRYALYQSKSIEIRKPRDLAGKTSLKVSRQHAWPRVDRPNRKMGLMRVCREVRNECRNIFYAINAFRFNWYSISGTAIVEGRMSAIGAAGCTSLRRIEIQLPLLGHVETSVKRTAAAFRKAHLAASKAMHSIMIDIARAEDIGYCGPVEIILRLPDLDDHEEHVKHAFGIRLLQAPLDPRPLDPRILSPRESERLRRG